MTVMELMQLLVPRLGAAPLCSIVEAVRETQSIIANRLLLKRSKLLIDYPDDLVFAAGVAVSPLPANYRQLADLPTSDGRILLKAGTLPTGSDAGVPRYFEVQGRNLRIWPVPTEQISVSLTIYKRLDLPTMAGDLPFDGEFDHLFVDACGALMSKGLAMVADRSFVAMIDSQVDQVLLSRDLVDEELDAESINRELGM